MKRTQKKGFTLAELLIVVAIIGVLVAIAIPIFSSQLKKSRMAVDQANVRSAKEAAAVAYQSDGKYGQVTYVYNGSQALELTSDNLSAISAIQGYGKSEASDNQNGESGASGTPKGNYVEVTIDESASEQITATWTGGSAIYDPDSGVFNLTGKAINNGNILAEIQAMGIDPGAVKEIRAAKGSTIDNNTMKVFAGLTNLEKIDLSQASLVHSSAQMFSEMPSSVKSITLPQCTKPYDIAGEWYYEDGTRLAKNQKWSQGTLGTNGSRVQSSDSGKTIYSIKPAT